METIKVIIWNNIIIKTITHTNQLITTLTTINTSRKCLIIISLTINIMKISSKWMVPTRTWAAKQSLLFLQAKISLNLKDDKKTSIKTVHSLTSRNQMNSTHKTTIITVNSTKCKRPTNSTTTTKLTTFILQLNLRWLKETLICSRLQMFRIEIELFNRYLNKPENWTHLYFLPICNYQSLSYRLENGLSLLYRFEHTSIPIFSVFSLFLQLDQLGPFCESWVCAAQLLPLATCAAQLLAKILGVPLSPDINDFLCL